jgi:hypothetical protein
MTHTIPINRLVLDIRNPAKLPGTIWGLTTFYNPVNYQRKLANFRQFSQSLRSQHLKLLTIELAFGNSDFELTPADSDVLLQFRTDTRLWHKERLLNIGLRNLPRECDKIVWLDGDIIFYDETWVEKTCLLLEQYSIVQPFSFAVRFPPGKSELNRLNLRMINRNYREYQGFIYNFKQPVDFLKVQNSGLAWAGRRDIFTRYGFYDRLILGSGDKVMAGAFLGFRFLRDHPRFPARMIRHQNEWIDNIYSETLSSVGYQEGVIGHLFHGEMTKRNYDLRTDILRENDFDPEKDIRQDANGIWEWATDKQDLHNSIIEYFLSREEDDTPFPRFSFTWLKENIRWLLKRF